MGIFKQAGCTQVHRLEGTDSQVLREIANLIARSFTAILKKAWRSWQGPRDLSKPNATPLLKESKKEDPQNYRLIILTSITKKNHPMCHTTDWESSAWNSALKKRTRASKWTPS